MKCPSCNKEVPDVSKFCNHCGHKFEQENTIKCTNPDCGHLIPADSKFCPDCGEKINVVVDSWLDSSTNDDTSYYMPFFAPNGKVGFKDRRNGQTVIEAIYDFAKRFSEGLAVVVLDNKYGFIDVQGHVKIPFMYDYADSFKEGLAVVENCDEDLGFIDLSGKEVIPAKYCRANSFHEGLALVGVFSINDNIDYAFINKRGNIVIDCSKYDVIYDFKDRMVKVERDGMYGFLNTKGEEVIPCKYQFAEDFCDGLALVSEELYGEEVYINMSGKVILPLKDSYMSSFSEGLAIICTENGYCGYINTNGALVIPSIYEDAKDFNEGLAAVKKDDKWGFIDRNNNIVIPFLYEDAEDFHEGLAAVSDGTHWGFVDTTGVCVVAMILDAVYGYENFKNEGWTNVEFNEEKATIDIFGNLRKRYNG